MEKKETILTESAALNPSEQPAAILRPISALERGASIIEELHCLATDDEDQPLMEQLEHLQEAFGEDLIRFVAVKFGIITAGAAGERGTDLMQVMDAAPVAERMLERHRTNPEEFRAAFAQVAEEERSLAENMQFLDLQDFEARTLESLGELAILASNSALLDMVHFAEDLDGIFQGKAFVSYLEHRYAEAFSGAKHTFTTPEVLAVQIALDFLSFREHYQLAIVSDYEALLASGRPDPLSQPLPPEALQNPYAPDLQ